MNNGRANFISTRSHDIVLLSTVSSVKMGVLQFLPKCLPCWVCDCSVQFDRLDLIFSSGSQIFSFLFGIDFDFFVGKYLTNVTKGSHSPPSRVLTELSSAFRL
jgi:hypothetical protein